MTHDISTSDANSRTLARHDTGGLSPLGRAALGLSLALVLATPALAQTAPATPATPAAAAAAAATSGPSAGLTDDLPRLLQQLVQRGYSDIREVERKSDKLVEVKARNSTGRWVELVVDSRSGEVLREKRDH